MGVWVVPTQHLQCHQEGCGVACEQAGASGRAGAGCPGDLPTSPMVLYPPNASCTLGMAPKLWQAALLGVPLSAVGQPQLRS